MSDATRVYTNDQDELTLDLREQIWTPQSARKASKSDVFDEKEHPRDAGGRFTEKDDSDVSGMPWKVMERAAMRDAADMLRPTGDKQYAVNLNERVREPVTFQGTEAEARRMWYLTGVFEHMSKLQRRTLPLDTNDAVDLYVGSSWFLNTHLRTGGSDTSKYIYEGYSEKGVDALVADLDTAFRDTPFILDRDETLYRGISVSGYIEDEGNLAVDPRPTVAFFNSLQVGDVLEDKGYLSTSIQPLIATNFGLVLAEINVPKGTKVVVGAPHEAEFILPRGMKLKVVGKETTNTLTGRPAVDEQRTYRRLKLELVNDD